MKTRALTSLICLTLAVAPALADEIHLSSGEILEGRVVERTDDGIVVEHDILGRLEIATADLAYVPTVSLDVEIEKATAAGQIPAAEPVPEADDAADWVVKAEIGATGKDGNSDSLDLRAAINGLLEQEDTRLKLGAKYLYGESEDVKNKDEFQATALHDWFLPGSDWFVFAGSEFLIDEFEAYESRLTLSAGAGYDWIKNEKTTTTFRLGGAAVREFKGPDDSWRAEGLLGVDYSRVISKAQDFEFHTTYYPDLEEHGEYRVVSTAAYSIKLDGMENLFLKLGLENEYDSHRKKPQSRNDLTWFISLLMKF